MDVSVGLLSRVKLILYLADANACFENRRFTFYIIKKHIRLFMPSFFPVLLEVKISSSFSRVTLIFVL